MSDRNFSALDHTAESASAYTDSITNSTIDSTEHTVRHLAEDVSELQHEAQAARQLRTRVNWLSGLLAISLIVLGGGLMMTTLSLRREQAALQSAQGELSQQVEAAEAAEAAEADAQINVEQLNRLEQQLEALNRQAAAISEQARGLTRGLPAVSAEQWAELQARIAEVEKSIRETMAGDTITGGGETDQMNRQFDKIDDLIQDFRTMLDSLTQTGAAPETPAAPSTEPTPTEPAN